MKIPTQRGAYKLAQGYLGLKEKPGPAHEAKILEFFSSVGHEWVKDDETAWCAAFVGAMLERTGLKSTRKLNARSYLEWGEPVDLDDAQPGDIVVFTRGDPSGWQGHVAFYVSKSTLYIRVLGGNQRNAVTESNYPRDRLLGIRRHKTPKSKGLWAWLQSLIAMIRNT